MMPAAYKILEDGRVALQAPRGRVLCCVPHCRRTVAQKKLAGGMELIGPPGATEWVCQKHWAMIPSGPRQVYGRATRALRWPSTKKRRTWPARPTKPPPRQRNMEAINRLWAWIRRAAIQTEG